MSSITKECLVCKQTEKQVPLTRFDYQETSFWICPQHIPVLIHDPQKLVALLPGAEGFQPG
jgi:hypothetical protein